MVLEYKGDVKIVLKKNPCGRCEVLVGVDKTRVGDPIRRWLVHLEV